jgi:hypothetical protein
MAEKRKKSLVKAFAKAVGALALTVALGYGAFVGVFYAGRGERLTDGEAKIVKSIFGNEIDASKMCKHFKDNSDFTHFMPRTDGTVLPFISHIDFFGKDAVSSDFSSADPRLYGLFVHESTHVWQNQSWSWSAKKAGVYEYTLTPGARFADFGMEQQADIIRDYALRFLNAEGRRNATAATAEQDSMLQKVVEDRFPAAKATRLGLDAQDAARPAPPRPGMAG